MQFDINFYRDWLTWAEKKLQALVAAGKVDQAVQFFSEFVGIVRGLFALFGDLATCFRSGFLGTAANLLGWAKNNKDPLANARAAMRAMQSKWGTA